jgi:hypothetical protein
MVSRRLLIALAAAMVAALVPVTPSRAVPPPAPGSFTFAAAGDMGAGQDAAAVLSGLSGAGTDFFLHVGDMSYRQVRPEPAWCNFARSKVGATLPYEIVAGEHDAGGRYSGTGELIDNFAACMPDRMGSTGTYGKRYSFDYPPSAPLARILMISPGLSGYSPQAFQPYTKGSANYAWVEQAIDGARAAGVRWVIVGMAFDCITAGEKQCEVGADLFNLLIAKKVDLILQGHEHGYERSKQLALGAACPTMAIGRYQSGCVADDGADNTYAKDAGPVVVISGTAGITLRPMFPRDPEAPYFVKLMGSNLNPSKGFMRFAVTPTQLTAQFVPTAGTFSDAFTIAAPAPTDHALLEPGAAAPGPVPAVPPAIAGSGPPAADAAGYWMLSADGRVFNFGQATGLGQPAPLNPDAATVDIEPVPAGGGYWVVDSSGAVHPYGSASAYGDADRSTLATGERVISLSSTRTGHGYWLFTDRGRVLPFGDAPFYGDLSGTRLNRPIVDSTVTASGLGYDMVAADGGVFAFGDAAFHGSTGGLHINAPVRSLVPTAAGDGYWLVAADGGVFAFDAPFRGSMGATHLNRPVTGMVRYGAGYLMVGEDGGIFTFSDRDFAGSLGADPPNRPIVAVAAVPAP